MQPNKRVIQQGPLRDQSAVDAAAMKASEQRWAGRRQRNTPAHLIIDAEMLGTRAAPIPCILKDTSSTGARIELARATAERWISSPGSMPEKFRLQIPSELVEVQCRIAWCEGNMIGVQFTAPARVLKRNPRPRPAPKKKSMLSLGNLFSK